MKKSKTRRLLRRAERFDMWGFHTDANRVLFMLARDYVIETHRNEEEPKGE